jgi:two-component system CheB/CheR fusion protein
MPDAPDRSPEQDPASGQGLSPRVPIAAIGASAGGVGALQAFFEALPDKVGVAFVVVIHLDPDSSSELPAILAARTAMPVMQIEAIAPLEADHVYVIPPNRRLRITDDEVAADTFDEPRGQRAPIDLFLRSLAEQHGDGFAIVLTGAGSDGAAGVTAVKEAGGIILVQDPNEAEYASMPRSAIATGAADFILPIKELAERLVMLVRNKEHAAGTLKETDEEYLRRILAHLQARTGHDFSRYKRSTIVRRISRRMQVSGREQISDYYAFMRDNVEEVQALFADLLISVTAFFRDAQAFESLAEKVIPRLFEDKNANHSLRVWVAGCATGEEAYSVGMLLLEELDRHESRPEIQVFGSDLDAGALAIAREGRYPVAVEADLSEERVSRFFTKEGDHYRVKRELRDLVLFATHSLLKDPPFSRLDLILCRNLLIYLDRELQQHACTIFHYALNPGGYLFLGSSESADSPPNLFRALDRAARIYQAIGSKADIAAMPRLFGGGRVGDGLQPPMRVSRPPSAFDEARLRREVLERLAPPSALVDDRRHAIHLSEGAGRFLQPSGGPLSDELTELVRPELRLDLRSALYRAFEHGLSSTSMPVLVQFNGSPHRVHLHVQPIRNEPGSAHRQALVLFLDGGAAEPSPPGGLVQTEAERDHEATVKRLREELQLAEARLKTTREESETVTEELRAANEELQSVNEEYRSTAEELETSKEELQSINEELQTVNSELKMKLDGISRAHSDLQNLMSATDYGTLFLDTGLRIKLFTPRISELFNIKLGDEGRPVTDFTHHLDYPTLAGDARKVLNDLTPIEKEIRAGNQGWYMVRLRPYRTVDNKIDGIVATFLDTSERHRAEEAMQVSEDRARRESTLIALSRSPIFAWEFDGGIVEWNRGSEQLYGYTREEALGQRKEILLRTVVPGSSFTQLKKQLAETGRWSGEVRHRTRGGRELTVETDIELVRQGGQRLALESTQDVTDRKAWERQQRLLLRELTHRVKNTLAVVQSIAHQTVRGAPSLEEFVRRFEGRLVALGNAHNLLVESDWRGADLRALALSQLQLHAGAGPNRAQLTGEPFNLPAELATPLALVLHELATNAAKYGALSNGTGWVELSWHAKADGAAPALTIRWQEHGGPSVRPSGRTGFGSVLIREGLPNAKVRLETPPEGVVCTIELPVPERPVPE